MNGTTIKPNAPKCSKCGTYDHLGFACPFHGAPGTSPAADRRPRSLGIPIQEQICYPFQDDRCYDKWCRRRHCCKFCGGDMPAIICSKQGQCAQPRHNAQYQQGPPPLVKRTANYTVSTGSVIIGATNWLIAVMCSSRIKCLIWYCMVAQSDTKALILQNIVKTGSLLNNIKTVLGVTYASMLQTVP